MNTTVVSGNQVGGKKGQFVKKEEDRQKERKKGGVGVGKKEEKEKMKRRERERELEGVSKEGAGRKRNGKNCHAKW